MAEKDPGGFVKVVAGLMPSNVNMYINPSEEIEEFIKQLNAEKRKSRGTESKVINHPGKLRNNTRYKDRHTQGDRNEQDRIALKGVCWGILPRRVPTRSSYGHLLVRAESYRIPRNVLEVKKGGRNSREKVSS